MPRPMKCRATAMIIARRRDRMSMAHRTIGVIGAGQMGSGIAHVCALAGYDVVLDDIDAERVEQRAWQRIDNNMARQVARGKISDDERKAALARITPAPSLDEMSATAISSSRRRPRTKTVKRKIFAEALPASEARGDPRHQHLVDLDHAARGDHRPAGALHRHAFHESGAGDAAGRTDPRHRHR